jgi:16S rRNA (adenine1518-N6/adenine1519-N6)-dimethyltransferase
VTSPRTLLKAWQLRPRKQWGQNFLSSPETAHKIVTYSQVGPDDVVLEIGAGLGALTVLLAQQAAKVYAVEKDRRMAELLQTELLVKRAANVELVVKSILDVDIRAMARAAGRPLKVVGNLPYYLSSQIMIQLIQARRAVQRAVLMFQSELAQRLMASPGSKDYGRLTVMLQYCAQPRALMDVSAEKFYPRPKVDSTVIAVDFGAPIATPVKDEKLFARVVQAAFGQRRKTLRNALAGSGLGLTPTQAAEVLQAARIDPQRRAETLAVDEFVDLSNRLLDRYGHSTTGGRRNR